jgi:hypothetical protein
VVGVKEKSRHKFAAGMGREDERKRTTDEVSKSSGRRQNWGVWLPQDKPKGTLLIAWVAFGMKVA